MEEMTVAELIAMVVALQSEMRSARASYEKRIAELEADNEKFRTRVGELEAENKELKARVAELTAQVRSNSSNSSKPPSTDGPAKPAPKSLRKPSGRKPGGQHGHPGSTLDKVADPDEIIRHEPAACAGCGSDLVGAPEINRSIRHVFDIPPITVRVTEHQVITRRCHCGKACTGAGPDGVLAATQYGPNAQAIMIYLFMGQFLSKKRTARALSELFGTPVSTGTVAAVTRRAAADLEEFTEQVRAQLVASPVVNFDETGLRSEGHLAWLHSASTRFYSLLFCHRKRGVEAMEAMNVLPKFTGTAVHDAWAPYDTYTRAHHALCGAHVLRELQAVTDHHATTADPTAWCWADQVSRALLALNTAATAHPGQPVPTETIELHTTRINHALAAATHPDGALGRKHRALARRLKKRLADYLKFAHDPQIPFTNNSAEQEIRMAKIREKISGTMRAFTGATDFATLRSYIQTTAKHGIDMFAALTQLTSRNPWLPGYP